MSWRKWLIRVIATVFFTLVLRTAWLIGEREVWRAEGNRELVVAFAETEQHDPDWRWDQITAARKQNAVGHNSAEVVRQVLEEMPPEWTRPSNPKKWQPGTPSLPGNTRYSERDIVEIRENLKKVQKAINLSRTLRDYPEGHTAIVLNPDMLSTQLRHVDALRLTIAILQWDAVLCLEDDLRLQAADDVLAMLNASRSIADEPMIICQLVRISNRITATRSLERTLGQTELPGEKLASLQAAWTSDAEEPLLLYGLRGDRAAVDFMLENLMNGTIKPADINVGTKSSDLSFDAFAWWLYRGHLARDRAFLHRYYTAAVEIARLPIHEQPAMMDKIPQSPDQELIMANLFLPAVEKVAVAHWRGTVESRCAATGIACERFRLKSGSWPDSLSDLTPELLPAIPLDPFNGQPLRYQKLVDGVAVSSVGKSLPGNPRVVHPGLPDEIEMGFRLWNPASRHQTAHFDETASEKP
ncbi:MAG TPA: hypothetical protein VG122_26090 [Gemmata sp.]|jgi:hypothetical protein|nr:hypothetical protein [Gemmata sp.]